MTTVDSNEKNVPIIEVILTKYTKIIYEIEVDSYTFVLDEGKSIQNIESVIEERTETGDFVYYERRKYDNVDYLEQYDYAIDLAIKHNLTHVRLSLPCHICNNIDQFVYKAYGHIVEKYQNHNLKIYLGFLGCREHNYRHFDEFNKSIRQQTGNSSTLLNFMYPNSQTNFSFRAWLDRLIKKYPKIDIMTIIPKETFSKMKKDEYLPSKITILSIIIGFNLDYNEAEELLHNTGYHLSPYIEYDQIIIEAIHVRGISGTDKINETNKVLLSKINSSNNRKSILSRYKYYKQLLGIKDEKVHQILLKIKPHITFDEYNAIKNKLG